MQSTIILLFGFATLALAGSDSAWNWEQFKEIHGKVYRNPSEEKYRRYIFEKNIKEIKAHNELYLSGLKTYSKSVNKFADMKAVEVFANGLITPSLNKKMVMKTRESAEAPASRDWRKEPGVVTGMKDQKLCGSCWAFSATGSLEGQMKLRKNKTVSLSEQQLVDCSGNFGNHGCRGGLMSKAFDYIKDVEGIESEESYPYEAKDKTCRFDKSKVVATVTGYEEIPKDDEEQLKKVIGNRGPVSVAIHATGNFQLYRNGIFVDNICNKHKLNHGVLAVGYGTEENGGDYYIVKNSWGPEWGEEGYIRMARRNNMCGIATQASIPTV